MGFTVRVPLVLLAPDSHRRSELGPFIGGYSQSPCPTISPACWLRADVNTGDMGKMTVATSEGVGGAVDGTSAETLVWSPQSIELVNLFKSPWKNQLTPGGGSAIVPSTGKDTVLEPDELKQIIAAGKKISATFEPAHDSAGKKKPWDIEFGSRPGSSGSSNAGRSWATIGSTTSRRLRRLKARARALQTKIRCP